MSIVACKLVVMGIIIMYTPCNALIGELDTSCLVREWCQIVRTLNSRDKKNSRRILVPILLCMLTHTAIKLLSTRHVERVLCSCMLFSLVVTKEC